MSGYSDLRDLGVAFVPPDSPLPPAAGRYPQFTAAWSDTVTLLARELEMLDAKGIAIELDMEPRMFRQDGLPRSDARARSDGVRISFTSKYGPLRYETNEFGKGAYWRSSLDGWQQNVRAIALALEALRKVDRYGVSKRGEQYRGWKALPTGTDPADSIATPEIARQYLAQWGGDWKAAVKATHPDTGGDPSEYRKVIRAKELVGA